MVFAVKIRGSHEFTIEASGRTRSTDRCELDTHADTIVGGANTVLLEASGETATVHSFSDDRKPFSDVPIGTIATSWVDPKTSEVYLLVMHEALYFGDNLDHSLICPNQLRSYGIVVDDTPSQFDPQSTHSIVVPGENVMIPLEMSGVISFFSSHKPSEDEILNSRRLILSSDRPWDPGDPTFNSQEQAFARHSRISELLQNGDDASDVRFDVIPEAPELLEDDELAQRFVQAVNVAGDDENGDGMNGYEDAELFQMAEFYRDITEL